MLLVELFVPETESESKTGKGEQRSEGRVVKTAGKMTRRAGKKPDGEPQGGQNQNQFHGKDSEGRILKNTDSQE